ncbi:hypothetical protein [Jiulongibacter sp. NS-SX5]|uniref:hypothetical protein n=1 Tax=Jiulongibacter sp. NS-SX5 TaxID=3463854 RepID=UPI004059B6A4
MKTLQIFLFCFCLNNMAALAQEWKNPAEKYSDVHKKYRQESCPIERGNIKNFIYFSKDRASIKEHPFLRHSAFKGAQIMYSWRDLETDKGDYDFSEIKEDLAYLNGFGKKLFIQLQDATFFNQYSAVPPYLLTEEYNGGQTGQIEEGEQNGWVAKRWNAAVQERFAILLLELGKAFDGKIEGINLQETAIGVDHSSDPSFSEISYLEAIKSNMKALKAAFPISTTMIYANFMPGEWLPWEDKNYLKSIYAYGEAIGVGLGGPDLMITRKAQLNHALALMHEGNYTVPLGIAVQDGNYIGKTGADKDYQEEKDMGKKGRINQVPVLHAFAKDFLKVDYIFWVYQPPYFVEDVLPCFVND